MMIKPFKVSPAQRGDEDTRTPEQKEEAKKRLEEMIAAWAKLEAEHPEIAKDMYC